MIDSIQSKLHKLLERDDFSTLTLNNQSKTPIWQFHFGSHRFRGMRLDEVVNQAHKFYNPKEENE